MRAALQLAPADTQAGLIVELRALRKALEAIEAKVLPFDVPRAARNFLAPTMRDWVNSVISHIAYQYGVSPGDLVGPARTATIIRPRFILAWVLRNATEWSYPRIGAVIDRDHSSVMDAVRKVDRWRAHDPLTAEHTDALLNDARSRRLKLLAAITTQKETTDAPQS